MNLSVINLIPSGICENSRGGCGVGDGGEAVTQSYPSCRNLGWSTNDSQILQFKGKLPGCSISQEFYCLDTKKSAATGYQPGSSRQSLRQELPVLYVGYRR